MPTTSGRTARLISAHRPNVPVLAISPRTETVRRLSALFGVTAVLSEHDDRRARAARRSAALAAHHGIAKPGDLIAITAASPTRTSARTCSRSTVSPE